MFQIDYILKNCLGNGTSMNSFPYPRSPGSWTLKHVPSESNILTEIIIKFSSRDDG